MAGFRCLKISAICFLAAITATACGQERTWTSGNGKYEIEATMVEQLDDSVKLKRSDNGKLITVPLNRLSKADQDFLNTRLGAVSSSKPDAPDSGSSTKGSTTEGSSTKGSTEGNSTEGSSSKASSPEDSAARGSSTKDSSPKGSATKGSATKGSSTKLANLNVSARAQWSKFPYENENARDLELLIEAKGEAAATAVRFGLLKMQTCETDKGPIETKEENITKEFAKVKRSEQEFFNEHPKDGVRVVLKFEHPNEELSRFETVKGEFKIKTGGSRQTIELADVLQTLDKNIDDPKLKALGLEVKPNRDEGNVRINLQGKLDSVVKVHLLDQRGNKPDGLLGTSWGGAGNAFSYNFQFENDASIPANLMFRIDVAEDLEELAIPFDLQKVDIPSK